MLIIQIDQSTLPHRSLTELAQQCLAEPGDYEMLHEEIVLNHTFRWGASMDEDGRYCIVMDVFNNDDGEEYWYCNPITAQHFAGKWVIPNTYGADVEIQVQVNFPTY